MPTQKIPRAPQKAMLGKHFYVITVGKMTGVFFENWEDVKPLVLNVSGSQYQAFSTYDAAREHYAACYREGVVRVVRNPGDHEVYGSLARAKQRIE
ncbi:hypothetical protein D9613_003587 [Agrocybe pediades]|uniref:Ribonuclease H1 N-terminal domain-containing protein n=1 Tax=Agrocybe pediades TaxID=84607 RepID=A0A8H4VIM8_9AGAR|nr:hypothetical protein D9613_003587 [Agrocybe pediades]